MKIFKCQNCHNESKVSDKVLMVACGCGYMMEEIKKLKEEIGEDLKDI